MFSHKNGLPYSEGLLKINKNEIYIIENEESLKLQINDMKVGYNDKLKKVVKVSNKNNSWYILFDSITLRIKFIKLFKLCKAQFIVENGGMDVGEDIDEGEDNVGNNQKNKSIINKDNELNNNNQVKNNSQDNEKMEDVSNTSTSSDSDSLLEDAKPLSMDDRSSSSFED
eukprot:Anaeramoba_flamelloidesa1097779_13.p1 GENE.a1097779_13~~a1097779_13.p1  ORF type:complete len:184 (-),score=44.78 a1097779_13:27-536(-)